MQDITHQNFETELISASLAQPVLLDIWAEWCGPCKALGPVLEKLETDYAGRFKLVKLDADAEPEIAQQLSQMFGVRSIPFCVLWQGGQPVDGFVGALPEGEVKKFLDKHVPSADEQAAQEQLQEAEELLAEGDSDAAIDRLQAALATNPANDAARYDYLRALLAAGHWLAALEAAPAARSEEALAAAIAANKRDFDARFELAQTLFARSEFTRAMDELLEIVMRDKAWKDGLARKNYVAVLEIMGKPAAAAAAAAPKQGTLEVAGKIAAAPADPVVDAYRRKLSMALF